MFNLNILFSAPCLGLLSDLKSSSPQGTPEPGGKGQRHPLHLWPGRGGARDRGAGQGGEGTGRAHFYLPGGDPRCCRGWNGQHREDNRLHEEYSRS